MTVQMTLRAQVLHRGLDLRVAAQCRGPRVVVLRRGHLQGRRRRERFERCGGEVTRLARGAPAAACGVAAAAEPAGIGGRGAPCVSLGRDRRTARAAHRSPGRAPSPSSPAARSCQSDRRHTFRGSLRPHSTRLLGRPARRSGRGRRACVVNACTRVGPGVRTFPVVSSVSALPISETSRMPSPFTSNLAKATVITRFRCASAAASASCGCQGTGSRSVSNAATVRVQRGLARPALVAAAALT